MKEEGVVFTAEKFDIDKFCRVIEDLLGNHAEFIIIKIVDDFCKYLETTSDELQLAQRVRHKSHTEVIESVFRIAERQK